jgi:hypothetical protein
MRRFTRLTNGFSKKIENYIHAIAIHYMHYNFVRIHQSLRCTLAMAADVSKTLVYRRYCEASGLTTKPVPLFFPALPFSTAPHKTRRVSSRRRQTNYN